MMPLDAYAYQNLLLFLIPAIVTETTGFGQHQRRLVVRLLIMPTKV